MPVHLGRHLLITNAFVHKVFIGEYKKAKTKKNTKMKKTKKISTMRTPSLILVYQLRTAMQITSPYKETNVQLVLTTFYLEKTLENVSRLMFARPCKDTKLTIKTFVLFAPF